ncbi:MAG: hypothetical protein SVT52_05285 [Planctomycetota bacterium]|nr:hypothetical protein [Planctomycetota bacterium]
MTDRRTKICIWIIFLGLANFLVYVILYWFFWGEAIHGQVELIDGRLHYFLHPTGLEQKGPEVSRGVFIYSGIHSISIAATVGAIILAMLTLAKERIASSMRSTIVRGRTIITILATIFTIVVILWTAVFVARFTRKLRNPQVVETTTQPVAKAWR